MVGKVRRRTGCWFFRLFSTVGRGRMPPTYLPAYLPGYLATRLPGATFPGSCSSRLPPPLGLKSSLHIFIFVNLTMQLLSPGLTFGALVQERHWLGWSISWDILLLHLDPPDNQATLLLVKQLERTNSQKLMILVHQTKSTIVSV